MLAIDNLRTIISSKLMLKRVCIVFVLSFATSVPALSSTKNPALFDGGYKLYAECMREGMSVQLAKYFETRGINEKTATDKDYGSAIGTTDNARKAFAEKIIAICAPTKTKLIASVDAAVVEDRKGKFLVKDSVRYTLIEMMTSELKKMDGELIANIQAAVVPEEGSAPNSKFDSGKTNAPKS